MKKCFQKKVPSNIDFQSSEEDERILENLMATLEDIPAKPEDPQPSTFEKSTKPRKLSREPDATLDLHGKTREEAIMMVQNFISISHQQRLRAVLIITGKGYRSGREGPVLNQAVRAWLKKNGTALVQSVFAAPPQHGGTGALWVQLQ